MFGLNGKVIILGDTHFGIKRFSINELQNQLDFFNKQLFPYMEENNIKYIFQLGDIFDNRTTVDIIFMDYIKKHFFDVLVQKGIEIHTLMGNHDIAYRESRDVSLVDRFNELYPNNFILYKEKTHIKINDFDVYIVPWLVKGEGLSYNEIKDFHTILGHFEIRNFTMVKGHKDTNAKLTQEFFTTNTNVKNVFSGHFHIKDTKGLIKYLGTPFQINWNDYEEQKGFYVWDKDNNLEFFENKISKKHIKIKYNDENIKPIEVSGYDIKPLFFTQEEFDMFLPKIKHHNLKFFINKAKDSTYDEVLYTMKKEDIEPDVINNQEISKIIGTDYIAQEDITDTKKFILDKIKETFGEDNKVKILYGIFNEIDTEKREGK